MGYRYGPPPKPEDMLLKFDVQNGAIMRVAFGCFYTLDGHDPKEHDYYGWPTPDSPDNICQVKPILNKWHPFRDSHRTIKMEPIHLREEGYEDARVSIDNDSMSEHLDVNAWIDEEDDYIVRMSVKANFPTFYDKPIETKFTIFISNWINGTIDAVCHASIVVLPGSPFPDTDRNASIDNEPDDEPTQDDVVDDTSLDEGEDDE